MKLNPNCVRDILIELEKLEFHEEITIDELSSNLPSYNESEITYCCFKLIEADYITANVFDCIDGEYPQIQSIEDITFQGHEFLNNVRSNKIWKDVLEVGDKIGTASIGSIAQIASGVLTALINNHFGF